MSRKFRVSPYKGPAGGWGSVKALASAVMGQGAAVASVKALTKQNRPGGFMCTSCAWPKPAKGHGPEFCLNGAEATAWEMTAKRATPEFFASHTVAQLRSWGDHELENVGRLTHPMRYDATSDTYMPVEWEEAFAEIGAELRATDPHAAIFYASGRASLETSYMYQLFGRMYGTQHFPDSSNMCHETTSVALPMSIGSGVASILLEDLDKADCILIFGHNIGINAPRILHPLQGASKRGAAIITFNPLKERGLERFSNPQNPIEMLTGGETRISSHYLQLKPGGDSAAIMGLCKAVIAADDHAVKHGGDRVLDVAFLAGHTHGFDAFLALVRSMEWAEIEKRSGLARAEIEKAADSYMASRATVACFGMGVTQHRYGVETARMIINLLLLRGNIGRPGAGILPIRGHSNVQGQRTVGITEKPDLVPLDRLAEMYSFEPPRWEGHSTVETCAAVMDGSARAFISLGGNFLRAVPEQKAVTEAFGRLRLSVQIATKLNHTHLVPGAVTYLLPCLGRTEIDRQATGPQKVSLEDSMTYISASEGVAEPASPHLLSEPAIVAGMAMATLGEGGTVDWRGWVDDYSKVRAAIEATWPDVFRDFEARFTQRGGFPRPLPVRERIWKTATGKANFVMPESLGRPHLDDPDVFLLMTLRSGSQFNTTVYNYDDRLRGIYGSRMIVMMNGEDMQRLGIIEGDLVTLASAADDGVSREVHGLRVTRYDMPAGSLAGYFPELNVLVPLAHHAELSKVPASKSVPVRIIKGLAGAVAGGAGSAAAAVAAE